MSTLPSARPPIAPRPRVGARSVAESSAPFAGYPNVRSLPHPNPELGSVITLVGVRHPEPASTRLVRTVLETLRPDAVAVELSPERYGRFHAPADIWPGRDGVPSPAELDEEYGLSDPPSPDDLERSTRAYDVLSGSEFLAAAEYAHRRAAPVAAIDDRRALDDTPARCSLVEALRLRDLTESFDDRIDPFGRIPRTAFESLGREMHRIAPEYTARYLSRRDATMSRRLAALPDATVVVCGVGHLAGLTERLGSGLAACGCVRCPRTGAVVSADGDPYVFDPPTAEVLECMRAAFAFGVGPASAARPTG